MTVVGIYPTRSDSELPQMVLWAAGIPYELGADDAGGAFPSDLTGGGTHLLVEDADADDARSVLDDRPARKERS